MILKYNQQQDINRLLGCLSGADQALCPGRMLMTLTTYFIWENQNWKLSLGAKTLGDPI